MAGAQELKLLGVVSGVSPYVIRVQMALSVKGLSYDYLPEDLSCKSDLLVASNPVLKKVPVLIHDGRSICDSSVIVHYIDEALAGNGATILPSDPYDRAIARFWTAYIDDKVYIDDKLFPSCLGILKMCQEKAEKLKETFAAFELLEAAFAVCSKGESFFGGNSVGYLDIALGCFLCWFEGVGNIAGVTLLDVARTPRLAAWAERFRAAEPVKALLPGAEKTEAYVNTVLYPKWNDAAANNL